MKYEKHDNTELIREKNGVCVYELTPDGGPIRQKRFYVVKWDDSHAQVTSVVPNDMPSQSGTWFANGRTASAIGYVANGRTRKNAMGWFRKLTS